MVELSLGFLYNLIKDAVKALFRWKARNKRTLTEEQKLELRQKWKPTFEEYIWRRKVEGYRGDCIIRDVRRLDDYPEAKEGKGISAWFRVGLIDTYHRGVSVGLRYGNIRQDQPEQRVIGKHDEPDAVKVLLMGHIRYESIEAVDWDGDQYYNYPIIYCHFDQRGEPYEQLVLCEPYRMPHPSAKKGEIEYFREVADYQAVRKRSKKQGFKGNF